MPKTKIDEQDDSYVDIDIESLALARSSLTRDEYLEQCYAEGLARAEGLTGEWMKFGTRCCQLLTDKEALQAYAEPIGWSGKSWGKAALRHGDWFDGTRENPSATQLMTLAYFATISEKKDAAIYQEWLDEGANWDLATVRENCEDQSSRQRRGNSIKLKAEVSFDKKGNMITAAPEPDEKFAWDRSNGKYKIALKKVNK